MSRAEILAQIEILRSNERLLEEMGLPYLGLANVNAQTDLWKELGYYGGTLRPEVQQ